ncbi:MAG: glycosyltransferase family 9 protein [Candidatus Omnitrophica bacterium]|nr:glycosyltransferase family 9 protein [Candidatus Omnitrophota bacterium]
MIFRTDRIGEVLLATAAVDSVKRAVPGASVTFVTSGYSRDILSVRGDIKEILIFDTVGKKPGMISAVKLGLELRRRRFDEAIVLNPQKYLHLACFLAGIPSRIGYGRKWGFLLNKTIPDTRGEGARHEVEYTMELLKLAGAYVADPRVLMSVRADESDKIDVLLGKEGIDRDLLVVIHPGASNPAKKWPKERYIQLIRKLKERTGVAVAVLGDEKERELAGEIRERSGNKTVDLAGKLDLKGVAAVLKKAAVFIGNDSGPAHMAAALGVPVISIFGRNIPGAGPKRWGPWGKGHIVFHKPCDHGVCLDDKCPYGYECLCNVSVDEVFAAAVGSLCKRGVNDL